MDGHDPVDRLCRELLDDPRARATLRSLPDEAQLAEAAEALAAGWGLALPPGAIASRLAEATSVSHLTLGATMPRAGRALQVSRAPAGFMPIAYDPVAATVRWCDVTGLDCDNPFLEQSISGALREGYRRLMMLETGLEALGEIESGGAPAGLIFHTSRSGSTLVCRMLRAVGGTVVLAEPPVLDHLLQAPLDADARRRYLSGLFKALTAPWAGSGRRVVIKCDAWAVRALQPVLDAAGRPPWAFVLREPAAVVASQLRMPGLLGAAGLLPPEMFGLSLEQALNMTRPAYCAMVYTRLAEDVLAGAPGGDVCLIDHADLPGAIDRLLSHFGLSVTGSEREAMAQRAGWHAKRPGERYDPRNDAPITAEVQAAVHERATAAYAALRDLRSRR